MTRTLVGRAQWATAGVFLLSSLMVLLFQRGGLPLNSPLINDPPEWSLISLSLPASFLQQHLATAHGIMIARTIGAHLIMPDLRSNCSEDVVSFGERYDVEYFQSTAARLRVRVIASSAVPAGVPVVDATAALTNLAFAKPDQLQHVLGRHFQTRAVVSIASYGAYGAQTATDAAWLWDALSALRPAPRIERVASMVIGRLAAETAFGYHCVIADALPRRNAATELVAYGVSTLLPVYVTSAGGARTWADQLKAADIATVSGDGLAQAAWASLSCDERAMVDYFVCQRASRVVGVSSSLTMAALSLIRRKTGMWDSDAFLDREPGLRFSHSVAYCLLYGHTGALACPLHVDQ